jgi:hypothetical protein
VERFKKAHGIALSTKALKKAWDENKIIDLPDQELSKCLRDPCDNCKILLKKRGFDLNNFSVGN